MPTAKKALIVGGGHNALVCAAYLARAGLDVSLFEARPILGGAAVTEEFVPGFRNSTASYTVSLLNPKIIRDLALERFGLRILNRPLNNFFPYLDGQSLTFSADLDATRASVATLSQADAWALDRYYGDIDLAADLLRDVILMTPPNPKGGISDLFNILTLGHRFRRLSAASQQMVSDLFFKSAADFLRQYFTDQRVIAAFAFDGIIGNNQGPETPGSAYVLLHHAFGEVNGVKGLWGHARGGMGAISDAIAASARAAGARLETSAPVKRIAHSQNRVTGIVLEDGRQIDGDLVICGINPKLITSQLLPEPTIPTDISENAPEESTGVEDTEAEGMRAFRDRMRGWVCNSGVLRMNVALDGLPNFTARPNQGDAPMDHHKAGIVIAPSVAYLETAWLEAKTQGWSSAPFIEMLIPSTVDDSLAPAGKHVASLFCQYVSPTLPTDKAGGGDWASLRDEVGSHMLKAVDQYAPGFSDLVIGKMVLTPQDLEERFGLVGGDIFHGRLSIDQLFANRPGLGMAQYKLPLTGLYLCGSGAHPGGGVTGVPGHNAARSIVKSLGLNLGLTMPKRF